MVDHAEIVAFIEVATAHRGWISNSYAQVEYLLGNLIVRCRQFEQYAEQTATVTHSATRRVAKVRAMLGVNGPLGPHAEGLTQILDAFEGNHEVRNLLAHGFCEFQFTPTGDAGLVFRKFDRGEAESGQAPPDILIQRVLRMVDLEYHRAQLVHQAEVALEFFAVMHAALGWEDIHAPPPQADDA